MDSESKLLKVFDFGDCSIHRPCPGTGISQLDGPNPRWMHEMGTHLILVVVLDPSWSLFHNLKVVWCSTVNT